MAKTTEKPAYEILVEEIERQAKQNPSGFLRRMVRDENVSVLSSVMKRMIIPKTEIPKVVGRLEKINGQGGHDIHLGLTLSLLIKELGERGQRNG